MYMNITIITHECLINTILHKQYNPLAHKVTTSLVHLFDLGLTSLSTIFQSYSDSVWTVADSSLCSLLECCITVILCPRHFDMIFHPVHIILTLSWPVLALLSWCWTPSKRAASTIFKVSGMTWPGIEPTISRSQSGSSTTLCHCAGNNKPCNESECQC